MGLAVGILFGCGDESQTAQENTLVQQNLELRDTRKVSADPEIIFSYHKSSREGETSYGSLGLEDWQSAARPYDRRAIASGYAWEEGEWFRSDESGTEQFYHIGKRPAEFRIEPPIESVRLGEGVRPLLESPDSGTADFVVRFPGFDIWDVHLKPDPRFLSVQDVELGLTRREADLAERKIRFESARDALFALIPEAVLKDEIWTSGKVLINLPLDKLATLTTGHVQSIELPVISQLNACAQGCNMDPSDVWRLGQGRSAERVYVEPFHDGGIKGGYGNSARHSYGGIAVGILDHGWNTAGGFFVGWEDDYRGFLDSGFSRRFAKNWNCTSGYACSALTGTNGFPDYDNYGTHGAQVTSVIGSDFENNQGDGFHYDDVCYDPPTFGNGLDANHCAEWERSSSGMAPAAKLIGYGINATGAQTLTSEMALSRVLVDNPDVINMSYSNNSTTVGWCPSVLAENFGPEVEDAFDDGVFVVNAPRNSAGACKVDRPGNVPKVFTVGALETYSACRASYTNCQVTSKSPSGGLTAYIPGYSPIPGEISAIDLVAPGKLAHLANAVDFDSSYDYGSTNYNVAGGTSQAAPHVAGSAALLKEHFLRFGHSFVNNPGRLHAMMLGMGDRYNGSGYSVSEPSDTYGAGRLKMRYLTSNQYGLGNPFGWSVQTRTLTPSGGNVSFKPFGDSPLPASADFLKCVMFEAEDTSDDEFSSDVYLKVTLSDPVSGSCTSSTNATISYDATYDLKHMISPSSPEGRCVEVELINLVVADASLMTNTFCYYAGVNDREY